tara:strand:+ start:1817 stop:2011 length:195 start_codon:yes stop_codon:yes gene_type:complete
MTKFLKPKEVADQLQVSTRTLSNKRALGNGPAFLKLGHVVRYPVNAVDDFIAKHMHHNARFKRS